VSTTKERIGRYILLETVGRGAMGIVYRAEDPVIHRTVAVKVLHTVNGLTPEQVGLARERFSREGQALGSIDHPNIIRVFDVGEDQGSGEMYIVMEFVSGPNLEKMLAAETLDRENAVAIVGQLASGLDAAHARGIIHRDIKPSNILLTEEGTAKIADFGITLVESSALTQDIRELGTPAYMSPEQVLGKSLDSRADLFSLGVLTYEMLTNRKPFRGVDIVSIAHAIAHEKPVPISEVNQDLPKALDPVFEHILAKEPSDRFATGMEFHRSLRSCLIDEAPVHATKSAPAAPKRPPAFWGFAAAAVLAAVYLISSWGGRKAAPSVDAAPPPAEVETIAKAAPAAPAAPERKKTSAQPAQVTKAPAPKPAKKAAATTSAAPAAPASGGALKAVAAEARPAVPKAAPVVTPVPLVDVTISFAHRLRRGTLVVLLDGAAIFNEKFSKSKLAVIQTTVWDPLKAPAGGHTLSAEVTAEDGKTYVSGSYKFEFPPEGGTELRIGLKGDALTVKQKSG
jgi:hypothetical protein